MTVEEFRSLVEKHDWYYTYSDDHRYWRKGQDSWNEIQKALEELTSLGLRAEACSIYNELKPDDFFEWE